MRKKFLVLGLAAVMTFSLAACGNKTNSTETTGTETTTAGETASTDAASTEPVKQTSEVADYSQYVKLGQYTGLDITVQDAVVTDEDIESYKSSIVSYYNGYMAECDQITDRVTAVGDTINLDFEGLLDGVAFDGGTATGASLELGSGSVIESLELQLIGLEVGKDYALDCTFPEDYSVNADLAGKDVVFNVKVNYIEGEKHELEWGDELIKAYTSGEYETADAYIAYLTEQLQTEAESSQNDAYEQELVSTVVEGCEFTELPEEKLQLIEQDYYDYYVQMFTYYASLYGTDYATYLSQYYQMTDDDLRANCADMAESEVKCIMVSCEIAKQIGYTLSDEEYNSKIQEYVEGNSNITSPAAFVEEYGEEYIRESFIYDKVLEYLKENNNKVVASDDTATETETTTSSSK